MEPLCDYVISRIAKEGVRTVFMVSGGGGMFLIDALGRNKDLRYVCNHHEQASVMAAEGLQRTEGGLGVALVTTGPAGTNALTGVLCAWNDSIPLLIVSGQANSKMLIGDTGLRQRGVHEADITCIVSSVTKYAVTVTDPASIRYHFDKAIYLATHKRPGPVWIDIPIDVQSAAIDPTALLSFDPEEAGRCSDAALLSDLVDKAAAHLFKSSRPVILLGNGVRLAHAEKAFFAFIEKTQIPVVTTKNAFDIIAADHPLLAGRIGTYGQRAGNFAVQNADLVLVLGSRLALPTVGYSTSLFARAAEKIIVDIDPAQLDHLTVNADLKINADCKSFLEAMNRCTLFAHANWDAWLKICQSWKARYPSVLPFLQNETRYVNSYYFFEVLSKEMCASDVLVCDQGAAFYSFTSAFKNKEGQRAFTNGGFSPMGYGLPAAIGACFARGVTGVVCVHGDGGLQMNLGELQTAAHHLLPLKLFVFNNKGYLSIKHTQNAYFNGRLVGSDPSSGVSCPSAVKLGLAHNMETRTIENHSSLESTIRAALDYPGPIVVEVMLDPLQPYLPRVTSEKRSDGTLITKPLEDMSPLLPRDVLQREMLIPLVEES